ncbi:MAG: PEGA domain-containing protein [Myxococcales bacterium]|nr:PEGA domain-containing protein [Myxococcales bacterium]
MRHERCRWSWVTGAAALVTLLVGTAPATAQTERELLQQAREAMERGQEAYVAERWPEAADAFLAAYRARPFSAFLYNAGIALERQGSLRDAVQQYERYVEAEPDASDVDEVRARIERLRAALGAAEPDPGTDPDPGTEPDPGAEPTTRPPAVVVDEPPQVMKSLLSVETNPADARISVRQGGRVVATGPSPFAETLDEGEYEISVEHGDYQTITRSMRIRAGRVYVAILEMSQGEFLGYLRVVSDPPGARVYLDDREAGSVGDTPYQNVVVSGTHRIWVDRPGYEPQEREVEVGLGDDLRTEFSLERVTYGRLRVVANVPGATVLVDGREVGTVPYEGDHDAGVRRVVVRHRGMKDYVEEVDLQRGQLTPLRVRLRPSVSRSGAWAMLTLGVLTAGGGAALAILADGTRRDLDADRRQGILATDDSRFLRGRILSIGANAAFGLAGLLGILSIYYFVRDPLPDSEGTALEPRDWTLVPHFDLLQRAGGAEFRWSF